MSEREKIIKKYFQCWINSDASIVEWYFKCEYDGKTDEFDGVSLIKFNNANQIVEVKEFQSKIPHCYPYS